MSSQSSLALVWLARSVVVADGVVGYSVAFVAVVGGLTAMVLVAAVLGLFGLAGGTLSLSRV